MTTCAMFLLFIVPMLILLVIGCIMWLIWSLCFPSKDEDNSTSSGERYDRYQDDYSGDGDGDGD